MNFKIMYLIIKKEEDIKVEIKVWITTLQIQLFDR